jgi:predicted Zn-dependent protease
VNPSRALRFASVVALALVAAGPVRAADPKLGAPYEDEKVGAEAAKQAAAALGLVEDEALLAYVDAIGRRLVKRAPGYGFDYRFAIVDDAQPNAFAIPGGYVYVSRGLLALSNSEDELAGVLGHEIAHVALRHGAAQQQFGRPSPFIPMQTLQLLAFTRDLERSADRVGQGLAGTAGYDPHGITRFLESLGDVERLKLGYTRIPSFLETHPGTTERIAETAQRADEIAWRRAPGVSKDRAGHLKALEGIVVGDSAHQGVFVGTRFLHPDLAFTLRFPDGWQPRNTPRAVGALAPDRRAQVALEHAGKGRDPAAAADAWLLEGAAHGLRVDSRKPIRLAGGDAVRILGGIRAEVPLGVHATFLASRGSIYRIIGVTTSMQRHEPLFTSVARSFRPMTQDLLESVRELRVRLVPAQGGETLQELAKRSGSEWTAVELGVLNGVGGTHRFEGGELVKVAKSEAYRPEGLARAGGAP